MIERFNKVFWFYGLLGSLFSALAIASLAQKLFAFGLEPVMLAVLDHYRALVHPLTEFALSWLHWLAPDWSIPVWIKDLSALSFVGAFTGVRGSLEARRLDGLQTPLRAQVGMWMIALIFGAFFIGLQIWTYFIVIPVAWALRRHPLQYEVYEQDRVRWHLMRVTALFLLLAVIGASCFFVLDAQL